MIMGFATNSSAHRWTLAIALIAAALSLGTAVMTSIWFFAAAFDGNGNALIIGLTLYLPFTIQIGLIACAESKILSAEGSRTPFLLLASLLPFLALIWMVTR